ncbi:hypothetical protein N752_17800 [Desulforamulus aquiferis]|nr:hypothetical protein N752_17800 [Desulforamulus aquiferis]
MANSNIATPFPRLIARIIDKVIVTVPSSFGLAGETRP